MSVVMRTSHRIERINYPLTNRNKKNNNTQSAQCCEAGLQ